MLSQDKSECVESAIHHVRAVYTRPAYIVSYTELRATVIISSHVNITSHGITTHQITHLPIYGLRPVATGGGGGGGGLRGQGPTEISWAPKTFFTLSFFHIYMNTIVFTRYSIIFIFLFYIFIYIIFIY